MDLHEIMGHLERWDGQESFYREFYYADAAKRAKMLADPAVDVEYKKVVRDPTGIESTKTEERFFGPGINVALVKHPRYTPFFQHRHTFFEMVYVISGQCRQSMDGRDGTLMEGDICLLAPGAVHGIAVFDDSIVINVLIRYSTFLDIFLNTMRDKGKISAFFMGSLYDRSGRRCLLCHTGDDHLLRGYLLDMVREQLLADRYSDRIICSLLTIFFSQLTRRHGEKMEIPDSGGRPAYGDEMMGYIMAHYNSVTLTALAEEFHFSVPYCSKIVKQISGVPFSELVARIRRRQAANLLLNTQMSVAAISEQVGFKNTETFIRSFVKGFGMTPGEYRQNGGN